MITPITEHFRPPVHNLAREVLFMRSDYITFRSVTVAQRGERLLKGGGIDCILQRTPRWMEERGCGYCLRVHPEDVQESLQRLKEGSVPFSKVYTKRPNGAVEEMGK
jgi:hypothetical protein